MGMNKLFTIQDPIVLDILKEKGIYVSKNMPKERYLTNDTSIAYIFMMLCMKYRVSTPPKNAKNPIWAWPLYNDDPINKLIPSKTHKRGKYIRIDFVKDTSDILCSNYPIWKKVLRDDCIQTTFKDPPDRKKIINEFKNMGLIHDYQKEARVWSWLAMLDGDKMVRNMKNIQLSLWSISKDEITNIQEIEF